jgi:predicted nucleic acid-binding protein
MAGSSVYDTRFFFEYFYSPDHAVAQALRNNLRSTGEKIVSAVTIHELHRLNLKKLDHEAAELRCSLIAKEFRVVAVDYDLAILGAELSHEYGVPLADSVIAATALRAGCPLVSDDLHFGDIHGLKLIWPIV